MRIAIFRSPSARGTSTIASVFQEQIWTTSEVHPNNNSHLIIQNTRFLIGAGKDAHSPRAIVSRLERECGNIFAWILMLGHECPLSAISHEGPYWRFDKVWLEFGVEDTTVKSESSPAP